MRRLIQRTVTIVITTTWTISWQEDALHASHDPQVDPAIDEFRESESSQEMRQDTLQFPTVIEVKEVDLWVTKPVP